MIMFYGIVEDRHDPMEIGRVRVRVHVCLLGGLVEALLLSCTLLYTIKAACSLCVDVGPQLQEEKLACGA